MASNWKVILCTKRIQQQQYLFMHVNNYTNENILQLLTETNTYINFCVYCVLIIDTQKMHGVARENETA